MVHIHINYKLMNILCQNTYVWKWNINYVYLVCKWLQKYMWLNKELMIILLRKLVILLILRMIHYRCYHLDHFFQLVLYIKLQSQVFHYHIIFPTVSYIYNIDIFEINCFLIIIQTNKTIVYWIITFLSFSKIQLQFNF